GSEDFRAIWQQKFLPELVAYRPDIILISAGFDAHRLDPLADLNLQADDYFWLSQELAAIAKQFSEGRIISMLEGGYSLTALRECSVAHLRGLMA
ncbi:MAG: histone deacetylase family protein, partial [Methylococcales bacterium]